LKDRNSKFSINEQRNLISSVVEQFKFKLNDQINSQPISSSKETIINIVNNELNIANSRIPIDNELKQCILIPIDFHIRVLGFILVFLNHKEIEEITNTIKLLKIFTTQIAPIIHSSTSGHISDNNSEHLIAKIIEENIVEAKSSLAPISFALIRLVMLDTHMEEPLFNDYLLSSKNILVQKVNKHIELDWLTMDTVLVTYSGVDLFAIEKFCFEISGKIENLQISGNKDAVMTTKYSCVSYPQVANSPFRMENVLWKNLLEESEKDSSLKKV